MNCPECDRQTEVRDSREIHSRVRRRCECIGGHRFTTYEISVAASRRPALLVDLLAYVGSLNDEQLRVLRVIGPNIVGGKV